MVLNIVQGTHKARAKVVSVRDLQNFYPEVYDDGKAKSIKALIGCPGYRLAATAYGEGGGRGVWVTSTERFFTIIYNKLVEMHADETVTVRGTVNTSIGMCNFADNGTQILIVDGTYGYIYDLSTDTLTQITAEGFPANPTHCLFTDGYFLVSSFGSGQFYFSASYDGTSWNALDFATAEYSSDTLQGIVKTSNGTVWMIGKQSVELWANAGDINLPWRRISGAVHEIGCVAPYSIATNGGQIFFLGNGKNGYGSVFMGTGYDVQRISNPATEYQIKQLTGIQTAVAFTYTDESHSFYVVSFADELTLVYDITTREWHTRGTYNSGTGTNIRQFAQGYGFFNGKHYVGSYLNGNIYEMSLDVYDEGGEEIKRVIVTGHINSENKMLRHISLELDFEKGIGLVGSAAPQIMLQYSNDGGHTWSSEGWTDAAKSAGAIGEFTVRALWRRLGAARDRVYRIVCSDPVKWVISNAFAEVV